MDARDHTVDDEDRQRDQDTEKTQEMFSSVCRDNRLMGSKRHGFHGISTSSRRALIASHIFKVLSSLPLTMRFPLGLKATL